PGLSEGAEPPRIAHRHLRGEAWLPLLRPRLLTSASLPRKGRLNRRGPTHQYCTCPGQTQGHHSTHQVCRSSLGGMDGNRIWSVSLGESGSADAAGTISVG